MEGWEASLFLDLSDEGAEWGTVQGQTFVTGSYL